MGGPCPSLWKTTGNRRTGVRAREETYAMVHFLFSRWPRFLALLLGFVPVRDMIKRGLENGRGGLRGREDDGGGAWVGIAFTRHYHTTSHITDTWNNRKEKKRFWEAYIVDSDISEF